MKLTPYILMGLALAGHAQDDFRAWITARSLAVIGSGDAGEIGLPRHGHDPEEDLFLQSLEVGINFEAFGWLSGFANVNTFNTREVGEGLALDTEQEEWFLKASNLPYGLEFRGGQILNRIGTQNNVHQHGWDFIDANLSTIHFLGEEGLTTRSGEISVFQEFDSGLFGFSAALGQTAPHEEEEEEGLAEIAEFEGQVFTVRGLLRYNFSDFHQTQLGLNFLSGESEHGGDADVYGVDYTYTWRENGLEAGGDAFTASVEYFHFSNDEADLDSILVDAQYSWENGLGLGARYEYVDFLFDEEEVSRNRFSLVASYSHQISEDWTHLSRIQYNNNSTDIGDEDEIWLQVGFSYGGAEIR